MKTFQEFLAMKAEGLWLTDKNAVPGMSNVNPLDKKKSKRPKLMPKQTPLVKAVKPARPATFKPTMPKRTAGEVL